MLSDGARETMLFNYLTKRGLDEKRRALVMEGGL